MEDAEAPSPPPQVLDEGTLLLLAPGVGVLTALWLVFEAWKRLSAREGGGKAPTPRKPRTTQAMQLAARSSLLDTHGNVLLLWRAPDGRGALDNPNNLGWLNFVFVLALMACVNEGVLNYLRLGTVLNAYEAQLFGDVFLRSPQLLPGMAAMTAVFLAGYPLQRYVAAGREWHLLPRIAQYVLVLGLFLGALAFTRTSWTADWPFSHKAAILMQGSVLAMKLHSYLEVNRELAMTKAGLWTPRHKMVRESAPASQAPQGEGGSGSTTPTTDDGGSPPAPARARSAARRRRGKSAPPAPALTPPAPAPTPTEAEEEEEEATLCCGAQRQRLRRVVVEWTHQDRAWSASNAWLDLHRLVRPGAPEVKARLAARAEREAWDPAESLAAVYPANVTGYDLALYMCMPVLVYSPKFPRTHHVDAAYVAEKAVLCLGALSLGVVILANFIAPVLDAAGDLHPVEAVARTIIPFSIMWLLFFFIVFEAICNAWAEVTRLGDRAFYADWWNATTFTYFSRTWNRPVHEWLLKHCYLAAQNAGVPPAAAQYLTFGLSILAHELVINGMFGFISPWLLLFSCAQFPLMSIMRASVFKGKRLGNFVFWAGLILGVPLISVLYSREYCIRHPAQCSNGASLAAPG